MEYVCGTRASSVYQSLPMYLLTYSKHAKSSNTTHTAYQLMLFEADLMLTCCYILLLRGVTGVYKQWDAKRSGQQE